MAILVALVGATSLASLAIGTRPIAPGTVIDAVTDPDPDIEAHIIVRRLRWPRTVLAVSVGAALGLAGAAMQGLTRNPLADPGLLGVNAGAALGVVGSAYLLGVGSLGGQVWFALSGAAVAGVAVYALGSMGRGGATPVKLAVAGAAASALLGSLTSTMLLLDSAALDRYRFWIVGSLAGRDLDVAAAALPFLVAGVVLGLASAGPLNGLALGDDLARSLGLRISLVRATVAASVVLLCGAATAAAGPIWFIGLAVPHVARSLTGPDHRWMLPASMLLGAVALTVADIVGRVVVRPGEIEVGIVTAFVGAPVFIAFVRRRRIAEL